MENALQAVHHRRAPQSWAKERPTTINRLGKADWENRLEKQTGKTDLEKQTGRTDWKNRLGKETGKNRLGKTDWDSVDNFHTANNTVKI